MCDLWCTACFKDFFTGEPSSVLTEKKSFFDQFWSCLNYLHGSTSNKVLKKIWPRKKWLSSPVLVTLQNCRKLQKRVFCHKQDETRWNSLVTHFLLRIKSCLSILNVNVKIQVPPCKCTKHSNFSVFCAKHFVCDCQKTFMGINMPINAFFITQ